MRWAFVMVVMLSACSAPMSVREPETIEVQFGPVPLGSQRSGRFTINNPDLRNWKLVAVRRLDGEPVFVEGLLEEPDAIFTLTITDRRVEAHRSLFGTAAYDPPAVMIEEGHDALVEFDFLMGTQTVTKRLHLEGRALPFSCPSPVVLDFGTVALGQTARITSEFVNLRTVNDAVALRLGDVESPSIHPSWIGSFSLGPGEARELEFTFTPSVTGPAEQEFLVSRSLACPESSVRFFGDGVEFPLGASSSRVPWTAVGETREVVVTFTNLMRTAVTLTQQSADEEFELELPLVIPPALREPGSNRLRPGVLETRARFHPRREGLRATTLSFQSDLAAQPVLQLSMEGLAGSLRPVVTPSVVTLPPVPALTEARTVVRLEAEGTPLDDLSTWLRPAGSVVVVAVGASNGVVCVGSNTTTQEGCAGPPSYSLAAGTGVELRVVVRPLSPGHHAFDVTLTTNGAPASVTFRVEVDAT